MLLNLLEKAVDRFMAVIPREKPSPETVQSVRLIAHRGAHNHSQGIIENTLQAFDAARKLGCWGIEFDVHQTADRVLVVHHDATLRRLWNHNDAIASLKFNELRALAPAVPSLEEVVTGYSGSMHLLIELKTHLQEEILIKDLQKLTPGKQYHLLTLDSSFFNSLTQIPKETLLLVARHNNVNEFCKLSITRNYGGVLGHYMMMTNKAINKLRQAEQIVGVGMIDSKYSLYRELSRGITWIFTNNAAEIRDYLQRFANS